MARLLRDRYCAYDRLRGCDLATGDEVRLDALPEGECASPDPSLEALMEVMAHGREGVPRWIVADVRNGAQAAAMARRAADGAARAGLVPVRVSLYARLRTALAADLDDRTLLLIGSFASAAAVDHGALLDAAARAPRPHVLLTFASAAAPRHGSVVHEARAAYGVAPGDTCGDPAAVSPGIARHLRRAGAASNLQRAGRHAAAERLLREVAGILARRRASAAAAGVLIVLGRLLLERGRSSAGDIFEDAARLAQGAGHEGLVLDARLWQALARVDADRLTDAESTCRAVLLSACLSPARRRWASAVLARVLLWQGRIDEVTRLEPRPAEETAAQDDEVVAAFVDATAARVLLAAGDVFQAGLVTGALVTRAASWQDPLARLTAVAAQLRLASATGDLERARERFQDVVALAREAHAPLRIARARLVWHVALLRAGHIREARQQMDRLARMRQVLTPLLRRVIDARIADEGRAADETPMPRPRRAEVVPLLAATLVQTAHAEESDREALHRVLAHVARELRTSRVDLLSNEAGPVSALITVGTGLPTQVGARVLEAGIVIPGVLERSCREIGVPVRLGARLLAALACRWPLDREPSPCALETLQLAAAVAAPRVEALLADARAAARPVSAIPELVGTSAAMSEVRRAVERAARAPFAVLIEGESGVGKELVARAIHQLGPRRERRFADLNCAALPDDLLESELFGHARGAFTGAVAERAGLIEEADGGTLFLDELPDLSLRGQAKLLRVLQQHEVRRLGEAFSRKVDVRIVGATNRELHPEVTSGRFRPDLLYRLDVIRIRIPPLRDRPEDIPVLAEHFWHVSARRVDSHATLTHGVVSELGRYGWPGNVRELQNVMAALAVAAPARGRVRPHLLPAAITGATSVTSRRLSEARAQFERRCVEVALARAGGSRTRAASELGLSRQGLLKTMARLGIHVTAAPDAQLKPDGASRVGRGCGATNSETSCPASSEPERQPVAVETLRRRECGLGVD